MIRRMAAGQAPAVSSECAEYRWQVRCLLIRTPPNLSQLVPLDALRYNIRMNTTLKITKIGNSAGVVLPKEVLAHLGAQVGETLSLVTTPRGIELAAAEPDFEAQMAVAREVMARRKRALQELAK
jgi:putative addiction module antidote